MTSQKLVAYKPKRKAEPQAADSVAFEAEPIAPGFAALATVEPASGNPAAVYLAGLGSANSARAMRGALKRILRALGSPVDPLAFPWAEARYQHANAIRAALVAQHGPATVNQALCAFRGVMREAFRLGLVSGEDWARVRDVRGVKATRLPAGRMVPAEEIAALFEACDRSEPMGIRDAALLAVLRVGGVRRAELCAMDLEQIDLVAGEVKVIGKGNKEREIELGDAVVDLAAWIEVRGPEPGALFQSFDPPQGGGVPHDGPRRLTEASVRKILRRLAARAMIATLSPHDMRRTFVSELFDAGVDASTVQQMAGHESIVTTQRYDRRGKEPRKAAALLLKIPRG